MDWPPSPLWKWPRNFFWGGVFSYFVYKNDLKADKSWLKKFGILVTFWFDNCPTHGWSGSIGMPTCPVLNNCIFPLTDVQLGEGCWSVQVHLHVSWLVSTCIACWPSASWVDSGVSSGLLICGMPTKLTLPQAFYFASFLYGQIHFTIGQIHSTIYTNTFGNLINYFCILHRHRSTTFAQTSSTSPIPNNSSPLEHLTQPSPHQSL